MLSARSREVGVATEMLLMKAKQVSDEGVRRVDYALKRPRQCGYWSVRRAGVWLRLPRPDGPEADVTLDVTLRRQALA